MTAHPYVEKLPHKACRRLKPLIFFLVFAGSAGIAAPKDLSIGGGAIFGSKKTGMIEGNYRTYLWSNQTWFLFTGADLRLLFPVGVDLGVSAAIPLGIEYREFSWRPFFQAMGGYAHVDRALPIIEAAIGASIEMREFQGLRLYSGWNYMEKHGVVIGGLIFLAW
jgi:hypothetical protein